MTILPQPYVETAYPLVNSKKPKFSDPKKEKLYDVAFRTLQLCTHDTYDDCPYYEQLMYACDTRLEMLFTYAATDDLELPRQAIRLFASSLQNNGLTQARFPSREEQTIPMFALHFVLMLEDYVNHTGDLDFIRTEALWQDWQDFIDLHCTTFPETPFDPRSDCHAWSALPLWEFAQDQGRDEGSTRPIPCNIPRPVV